MIWFLRRRWTSITEPTRMPVMVSATPVFEMTMGFMPRKFVPGWVLGVAAIAQSSLLAEAMAASRVAVATTSVASVGRKYGGKIRPCEPGPRLRAVVQLNASVRMGGMVGEALPPVTTGA